MSETYSRQTKTGERPRGEHGQAIVLIVFIIVGLLAFAGIAVDAGFLFARSSQFSASVDAAALAGVQDLHNGGVPAALERSGQFLAANGWPISGTATITGSESFTDLGYPQFSLTVTWPVETFFLGILGFDDIPITHATTAAFYAQTNMPTATHLERGSMKLASQFIFGPDNCSYAGDPVMPPLADDGVANESYPRFGGEYIYRIAVPDDFITDTNQTTVRIQLFDPDSVNLNTNNTDPNARRSVPDEPLSLGSCAAGRGETCVVETGEPEAYNPLWLIRVDEAWSVPGGNSCPDPLTGSPGGNTITVYELFYRDENDQRVSIATFSSNDAAANLTDMKWVTPGVDSGVNSENGNFDVNLLNPNGDGIALPLRNGIYDIFMSVQTLDGGTAKNVWDIWAGSPAMADAANVDLTGEGVIDVNDRNLYIARNFATVYQEGINVYAVGRLPTNNYRDGQIELPIADVAAIAGGGQLYVSVFDLDGGASNSLEFLFDTLSTNDFLVPQTAICSGDTNCDNTWVNPQMRLGIPTRQQGVAFFGGNLLVRYDPNREDHTWSVSITNGRPFMTR